LPGDIYLGIHFRHPAAMVELRAAALSVWEKSGVAHQAGYEAIRSPNDPETFDSYLLQKDPLANVKMQVSLIVRSFDNITLGNHFNKMHWVILNTRRPSLPFLTSDRPVTISNLGKPDGYVSIPIHPRVLFVAVNEQRTADYLLAMPHRELIQRSNKAVVERSRLYVYAPDTRQERFVANHMSKAMEPLPLFPNLGHYPAAAT
jgi:hypothetical protein